MSAPSPSLGERLRVAREGKGLSAQKAADELHLDGWIIEALENGDFARIGPAVYGKGHLKRYAGLLGLPAADVIDAYERRPATVPPAASPSAALPVRAVAAPGRGHVLEIAAFGLIAVALAGLAWWQFGRKPAADVPAASAGLASAQGGAADTAAAADATADGSLSRGVATMPRTAPAASPPVTGEGETPAGAGRARLRLSFSADSWVDVRDAAGRRLFAGSGQANSVRVIAGDAPMKVYLGFAGGVQLEINGRVVAIGRQFVAGDVARFEAGADGVLRREAHAATASDSHPRG